MQLHVRVIDDGDILADLAATAIARSLRTALADRAGPATLFLSGGSTPRVTYTRLLDQDVDWSRVHIFLGDERWVDQAHQDSNARMAREAFVDSVPATFHPLSTDEESPAAAADGYERTLRELFGDAPVRPDLIILGIGTDGHTASLFPGTAALAESGRLFVANWVPDMQVWRLTATFPLLSQAAELLFLATGAAKAEVVAQILEGDAAYPAGTATAGARTVTWFLDRAAAAHLSEEFLAAHQ